MIDCVNPISSNKTLKNISDFDKFDSFELLTLKSESVKFVYFGFRVYSLLKLCCRKKRY